MNYLARAGQVFGPYTDSEVQQMRASGDVERFSWIWDAATKNWQHLDPPPAPLAAESPTAQMPPLRPTPEPHLSLPPSAPKMITPPAFSEKRPKSGQKSKPNIEAICHDFQNVISGFLEAITESGCNLVASHQATAPVFAKKAPLLLSLMDPVTGCSMNIQAKLTSASRENGRWHYRLKWEICPEILLA